MSITWLLEYTIHSCQVDWSQYVSSILSGLRYAMFARQSRFITERLPSYTPMFGTKAIHNIHYTYVL